MSLIKRKGRSNIYYLNKDINNCSPFDKEKAVDQALKQKYLDKEASVVLNKNDLEKLSIKEKMIDAPIKWIYYEKPAIINSIIYSLKMCIRKQDDKYYIHNIYSLLVEEN